MANADPIEIVDARGQRCPHPVLAARAALKSRASGTRIVLLATDPLAPVDVAAWCARTGCVLIEESHEATTFRFVIEQA
jgi:tRNA 2-thiouridine synthesizing protein A